MIKDTISYYQARFDVDEEGATMIEYGLLAALIAVVLIITLQTLTSDGLRPIFERITSDLSDAATSGGGTPEQ